LRAEIFVLGMQKSGTTAVAALLAEGTGLKASLDFFYKEKCLHVKKYHEGTIEFKDIVADFRLFFLNPIVKDPDLAFMYNDIKECFPRSRFIFVVRDPRDTLRSIFDRLDIDGKTLEQNENTRRTLVNSPGWKYVIEGKYPAAKGTTILERLSERWNMAVDVYLNDEKRIILIKYEYFMKDRAGALLKISNNMGIDFSIDLLNGKTEKNYQKPGKYRGRNMIEFWGEQNMKCIEDICVKRMNKIGYVI